ncbi:hypothetical protein C2G38_2185215 [Gigaspora rosea]|uniref:Uncharacterized protein n=1 Tax=Gigaspora rosea TaxID=44941 RepID=A0A397VE39_9GLOM|nr:hypothetical protein C2G38_2185215 [Gigaspora rosea]
MSFNQSKYFENNSFSLKQNNANYKYHVINEGFYPPKDKIYCTIASSRNGSKYRVPNNYLVQTSWGRNKSHYIVECEIEYELDGLIFIIRFEENSQRFVLKSKKSPTNVANNYLQKKYPNTCATIFRIHVFGFNAMDMERERNRKKKLSLSLKPFNSLSESMKTKRSRAFSVHLGKTFDSKVPKFFNLLDQPTLQEIKFNIQDKNYVIDYNNDKENSDKSLVPFMEDRLWELIIQEIKSENKYDNYIRMVIGLEMKRISIRFHFWQNHDTQNLAYTLLMGGDKEKLLRDFNFEVIFDEEQAILINRL